jgi:hypothetical protein
VSLFVLTIPNPSPALDKQAQEVALIARACELAAQSVRAAGGAKTSGNVIDSGGVTIGSFVYVPVATS